MSVSNFRGTGVALVTPFLQSGAIDFASLGKLIDHVISNGVNYIVSLGTTGETPTLTAAERLDVLNYTLTHVDGRVPVVGGIGGNNTAEVLETFEKYPMDKLAGVLSVVPYYNKPSQEGIYQHYKAIATVSSKPIILYNVPGRTGINMLPATTLRLANEFSNIVAIKEACGNIPQSMELVANKPEHFTIVSGDDDLTLSQIACGFDGVISVAANCYTKDFTSMVNAALAGDFVTARSLHYKLLNGIGLLFAEGNPAGVKCVLSEMHICENTFRLPVVPVSEGLHSKIKDFMNTL
jgi:4-hydroxy-tetrahydrodipicolinate synthase